NLTFCLGQGHLVEICTCVVLYIYTKTESLVFEEVLRLLLVGSLSSSEVDSDGGVIGLAISLPLYLVVA
ncbi:hypothetical protein Tco_0090823, partial [Tanacetum coccineum]